VAWAVAVHIRHARHLHLRLKCFKIKPTCSCQKPCLQFISFSFALSPRIHFLFFASSLVMDTLCSKCRSIFSTPIKGKLASQYDCMRTETLALHSDSIASLFASKSLPCHLCVLLWEAKPDHFEFLRQTESHLQVRHDPGRAEVRWRWEKTHFLSKAGPSGGNLLDSGKRLTFIICNLIGDRAEGISAGNWRESGRWDIQKTKYGHDLVVFWLSKGELLRFNRGLRCLSIECYSTGLPFPGFGK
jgi:hypothetical protein